MACSTLKVEEIALIFQSSQNMSVYSIRELRNKLQIIKNNLYAKQQENGKKINILDTKSIQSASTRNINRVTDFNSIIDPRGHSKHKFDNWSKVKYKTTYITRSTSKYEELARNQ